MYDVDVAALDAALSDGATVVDVREPMEWRQAHLDGPVLIPMGQLPARLDELDRSRPVYVLCRSGNRSSSTTDFLRHQGFDAYNVAGGLVAWAQSGRPLASG